MYGGYGMGYGAGTLSMPIGGYTQPMTYAQPAPMTYAQPAPMTYAQPAPMTYGLPAPMTYAQPAPMTMPMMQQPMMAAPQQTSTYIGSYTAPQQQYYPGYGGGYGQQQQSRNVRVQVHNLELNKAAAGFLDKADPYIKVSGYNSRTGQKGRSDKTKTKNNAGAQSVFNEVLDVPVSGDEDSLLVEAWDDDTLKDDCLGKAVMPLNAPQNMVNLVGSKGEQIGRAMLNLI